MLTGSDIYICLKILCTFHFLPQNYCSRLNVLLYRMSSVDCEVYYFCTHLYITISTWSYLQCLTKNIVKRDMFSPWILLRHNEIGKENLYVESFGRFGRFGRVWTLWSNPGDSYSDLRYISIQSSFIKNIVKRNTISTTAFSPREVVLIFQNRWK